MAAYGDPTSVPVTNGSGGIGGSGSNTQAATTTAPVNTTAPATTAPATSVKGETNPTPAPTTAPATTAPATTKATATVAIIAKPDVVSCTSVPVSNTSGNSLRIPGVSFDAEGRKVLNNTGTIGNNFNQPFKGKALIGATDFYGFTGTPDSAALSFDKELSRFNGWKNVLNTLNAPGSDSKRLISVYSDGGTDFMIVIEPADGFLTKYADYIGQSDIERIGADVKASKYIRIRYVGNALAKAVCDGQLPDFITLKK